MNDDAMIQEGILFSGFLLYTTISYD